MTGNKECRQSMIFYFSGVQFCGFAVLGGKRKTAVLRRINCYIQALFVLSIIIYWGIAYTKIIVLISVDWLH